VALRSHGYEVALAATGQQAIEHLRQARPDVMILDLGLPDMDGLKVAAVAHRQQVPIVVLSARGDEQQQILALDAGADDYVTKPFRQGELMARLRATLRRAPAAHRDELRVGDVRLDLYQRRVMVGKREVQLTPVEFKLLQVLAGAHGRVVTHERLLTEVWGPECVDEVQYLRVYAKQLRRKLEEEPAKPRRLLTVLGVGYRLTAAEPPDTD
jgi:two-component system KDP operon response regulator KdpE